MNTIETSLMVSLLRTSGTQNFAGRQYLPTTVHPKGIHHPCLLFASHASLGPHNHCTTSVASAAKLGKGDTRQSR